MQTEEVRHQRKLEAQRRYRAKHPEVNREYLRKWKLAHPEYFREYGKRWAAEHRDSIRENAAKRREKNREAMRLRNREWERDHPEKTRALHRKYRETHKEAERVRRRRVKHIRRVLQYSGQYESVSEERIIARDGMRCHLCGAIVTRKQFSLDHVIPISRGGSHTEANLRVAHILCNARKGNRLLGISVAP